MISLQSYRIIRIIVIAILASAGQIALGQDWDGIPVPADPGDGMMWELQDQSDDFNYNAPADNKGTKFSERWVDTYHNNWTGPGLTIWDRAHSLVADGMLQLIVSRVPNTNKVHTGIITSKERVVYPVYIEARAKIANSVLASDVWLLSPDDTQEIDIMEAYGAIYSEGTGKNQNWFAQRVHISHHVFIREPFQDYQPTDAGSWYYNGTFWHEEFHTFGVHWIDPWNLKYYIDGKLVRTVSGEAIIDPHGYTDGTGLSKAMDIIIDAEDQNWRSDQGLTPTDNEIANTENMTYKVDWIRIYKPVVSTAVKENETIPVDLVVIPNPFSVYIKIQTGKAVESITVYNVLGQAVKTMKGNSASRTIYTNELNPGVYFLLIQNKNGATTARKLVKIK